VGEGRWAARIVLATSVVALLLSVGHTLTRLETPSSGSVIAAGPYPADGLEVTTLPGVATPLRDGDIVTAIGGRSIAAWLDPAVGGEASLAIGEVVRFDVRRDGMPIAVDVPLVALPAGSILLGAWGTLAFVLAMLAMGAVVFGIRPGVPAAGALLLAGVGAAGSTVPYLLGNDPLDAVTGQLAPIQLGTAAVYLLLWAGLIDFSLVFPRPAAALVRRPALRLVPYVAIPLGYAGALLVALAATPDLLGWIGTWGPLSLIPTIATFIATPLIIAFRWRRADLAERRLLRGFAAVLGFIIVTDLVVWVVPEALGFPPLLPWTIAAITGLPFPIVIAMSILRHRAFDLDVVVRRSVVYGGLTVLVVAVYAVAAGALGAVLGTSSQFATSLLATGVAALAALPLRDVLHRAATRLVYGDRDEPVRAIRRLGERLELTVDPASMPRVVVDAIGDALRLPYVGLELGAEPGGRLLAERGVRPAEVIERDLTYGAVPIGRLLVAPRGPADPLSASDLRLLDDLGRQVGVAAHAALLTEDLRASRERLVAAREEERRRLRRDLHDGLGPALAAIGMRAGAAETRLAEDPEAAARLLAELQAEVVMAVGDVRRLVDGLRPPAIDEVGLVGALRLAADRLDSPGAPTLDVAADGLLPELPAAVEVAAYRIGTEAMTNAVRHAGASRCSLRLIGGSELTVVVEDDGRGLGEDGGTGVGLSSMHERAAELGGEFRLEARPGGGTRVIARLPLAVEPRPALS
jgi:signal transduction histidine kinase